MHSWEVSAVGLRNQLVALGYCVREGQGLYSMIHPKRINLTVTKMSGRLQRWTANGCYEG